MEAFVRGFNKKYPFVPVELYGKLSHLVDQAQWTTVGTKSPPKQAPGVPPAPVVDHAQWTTVGNKSTPKPTPGVPPAPETEPEPDTAGAIESGSRPAAIIAFLIAVIVRSCWANKT